MCLAALLFWLLLRSKALAPLAGETRRPGWRARPTAPRPAHAVTNETAGTHAKVRYRCFLPDLAGFTSPRCPDHKLFVTTCCSGEGGIRTHDTLSDMHAFQACAFNRSATSPAQAESVGFEPTVPLPVRLISSQVPSTTRPALQRFSCQLRRPQTLEETLQPLGALGLEHSARTSRRWLWGRAFRSNSPPSAPAFGLAGAVDHAVDPGLERRSDAERARLQGDHQRDAGEPPAAERPRGLGERQQLGVGERDRGRSPGDSSRGRPRCRRARPPRPPEPRPVPLPDRQGASASLHEPFVPVVPWRRLDGENGAP